MITNELSAESPPAAKAALEVIAANRGNYVKIVDGLLDSAAEIGLQLHWRDGFCNINALNSPEPAIVPMRRGVFRAILARVAVLAETVQREFLPYGGEAVLLAPNEPGNRIKVEYSNTPDQLALVLMPYSVRHSGR